MSREHSDYERAAFVAGARVDQNDPWKLLHERIAIGLSELRGAIAKGEPRWLVCRSVIVFPGVPRNPIPEGAR